MRDLFEFLLKRKAYWLLPLMVVLLTAAALITATSGTGVGTFIYTLF